ncbi:MAG: class I SAM-dependent methyltransferase [Pedosphaera sp.]|nr:class I SAM-dependent methyltransferase [Pedosphaera sp.]MSU43526.1 class I SAM-dependent methyltransferase [Pedosphaera sp.]
MATCNICCQPLGEPLYVSAEPISVTSLCHTLPDRATVFHCATCGHLQTQPLANLDAYYAAQYRMLVDSEEEDQLYAVEDGRQIFRTEHQVRTLLAQVALPQGARVLDYGCAKAMTLRALQERRPDIVPHAFDVSPMYQRFWEKFIAPADCAIHQLPDEWRGRFDLVTSFFALEHVADPRAMLRGIAALLKPGGRFYCIVPDTYANIADLVVADHVNHFCAPSLRRLMAGAGLAVETVDASAHTSAFVVVARKAAAVVDASASEGEELAALAAKASAMADYWRDFTQRVREFEVAHGGRAAIYGSGFYGTFIATCLRQPERVECFLDQNPHRQTKTLLGKPILAPTRLPQGINLVYVGLNPQHARAGIDSVTEWRGQQLTYFYP